MKKRTLFILIVIISLVLVASGIFLSYAYREIYSPRDSLSFDEKVFTVQKGSGVKEIAQNLEKKNFIRSAFWFEVYVWQKKIRPSLKAGDYTLSPSLSAAQIAEILAGGKIVSNEAKITFPEGFVINEIKQRLLENGVQAAADLGNEKIEDFQLQYKFLKDIPGDRGLEGFLFPDTYIFSKNIKKEDIIKKFLDNFDKKFLPEWRAQTSQQNRSLYDIIILASIIQREASSEVEMPLIAGVFWNRLQLDMLLQADSTVNYATGKNLRQATADDIKINSPYNTYLYKGLPPGPISNPGVAAIKAALLPQSTDFFYFLHPLTGPTVFSKTLDEHNKNKQKYLR